MRDKPLSDSQLSNIRKEVQQEVCATFNAKWLLDEVDYQRAQNVRLRRHRFVIIVLLLMELGASVGGLLRYREREQVALSDKSSCETQARHDQQVATNQRQAVEVERDICAKKLEPIQKRLAKLICWQVGKDGPRRCVERAEKRVQ